MSSIHDINFEPCLRPFLKPARICKSPENAGKIRTLAAQLRAPAERVILMPEGTAPAVLHERALWLAEICKNEGYRFSPRLHVDLYGNRRGV